MADSTPGFAVSGRKGFHVTFENGCTVSVQFGGGNYCDNRDQPIGDSKVPHSRTAEMAAWDARGSWVHPDGWDGDVAGWQSPAQVLKFMNWVAALPVSDAAEQVQS